MKKGFMSLIVIGCLSSSVFAFDKEKFADPLTKDVVEKREKVIENKKYADPLTRKIYEKSEKDAKSKNAPQSFKDVKCFEKIKDSAGYEKCIQNKTKASNLI